LLSSKTPFESKRLLEAGLDEIRRIIREEEPMRPSTRLHALNADEQTTVAKHRKTDPPKLISLIHGDLDWIVMKALEKDRTRRYETANGLATDIQRHLSNEPVMARPPSNVYRFQKTVQRHKLAVAAAAAVVAALAVGMGVSTWLFLKERQAHRNEVAAIEAQLREQQLARHQQERAEQEARLRQLTGLVQQHAAQSQWAEAEPMLREKMALQDKLLGKESLDTADSLIELGAALLAQRKWTESESTLRAGIAMENKFMKKGDPSLMTPYMMLTEMLEDQGRTNEAETIEREMAAEAPKPGSSELTNEIRLATAARTLEFMSAMQDAGLMPSTSQSQAYVQVNELINQKKYDKAEQVFSNVLTPAFLKKRQSTTMLYARAEFYARRGRWKDAAGDYSRLIAFEPSSSPLLYHSLGALLAQNGDLKGYRRICARVLDSPGGTNNPVVAQRTAKLCLFLPDAGVDLETVARMANNLVAEGENQQYLPFFDFVKGLASYRQGHFADAIKVMQKLVASDEQYLSAQAYLVLAMAQHQTGLDKEGRSALAKASDIVENELPKRGDGDLGQNWISWIFAHGLLNEARSLMDTTPKTSL
jgi:tetratricopeptide (TPR) repeat protein